jgi:UDP-glucose 4-epimerase
MTTILVTGIGGRLAQMVAGALAGQTDVCAVGVDRAPVEPPLLGIETHVSNMRGQPLLDLLRETGAEVVVHLAQFGEEQIVPGREAAVRGNVITTMELLGACAAAGVRRAVLRSSTLVYGARYNLPAFVAEPAPLHMPVRPSLTRDYVEIERFAADFAQKHPGLAITTLRCASLAGGGVLSPLARYLTQPTPRTWLGFDPRIQALHAAAAAAAFALAALAEAAREPLNIAADSPLTLAHAIRLAGGRPLPFPGSLFELTALFGGSAAAVTGMLPFDPDFLRFSCIADTRRAHETLGWSPRHSAEEALHQLAPRQEVAVAA